VLEKSGFKKCGETVDPETNAPVWRWENRCHPDRSEESLSSSDGHTQKIG
jgi:hypothetical protein